MVSKPEEIKTLLETGFEYVCKKDELCSLENANKRQNAKSRRGYAESGRGEVAW